MLFMKYPRGVYAFFTYFEYTEILNVTLSIALNENVIKDIEHDRVKKTSTKKVYGVIRSV